MSTASGFPSLPELPGLSRLTTDAAALRAAGADFGHVVHRRPRAVLRPASVGDVVDVLQWAGRHGIAVAARGRGHSGFGQAQVDGGVVLDMRTMADLGPIGDRRITVGAGASWLDVLRETLRHGLTPPVLTDYLGLSVGGTLCVGGIGGTSHRHGVHTDNVVDLEIVTGDGVVHAATPGDPLGRAVLAGLGQCGVITPATLRLLPAPQRVRRYKLCYPDVRALTAVQRRMLHEKRFDYLEGQIVPGEQGWRYLLEVARYYTPPDEPDDDVLVGDLGHIAGTEEIEDCTFLAFADRIGPAETYLRATGEWLHPHPWWNAFLPDSTADEFVAELAATLLPADLGASGLVLVYPVHTGPLRTPLFRVPAEPVVFLVALLRFGPPDDPAAAHRMVADNRHRFERARRLGAISYPVGAIPFGADDWRTHFGDAFGEFVAAKRQYDPRDVLAPGQGIV
jgi:cytokinin dehydrogenase